MPKPRKKELHRCRYFSWLLGQRDGVYFADGRSNQPSLGRHSLSTRDRVEALTALEQLDLVKAVEHRLAERHLLSTLSQDILPLEEGRRLYEGYAQRPRIAGGPGRSTAKRYRAVFDKFLAFTEKQKIRNWNEITAAVLDRYAAWLDDEGYAYATEYLELNTIKQVLKYLVTQKHLPPQSLFTYPLRKADGTETYCWRADEVQAMINECTRHLDLLWLRDIIVALASTGLRISELAGLRWTDVDLDQQKISLTDETGRSAKRLQGERRTTKSGYSRTLAIHPELLEVLQRTAKQSDNRVFHGPLGGKIKPDTVRRILVRDVLTPLAAQFPTPAGAIGFADGRLHSFRHFFCSRCANEGIPEQVLMSWLGHRNSKMVRHYYHLHDQESRRQINRLKPLRSPETCVSEKVPVSQVEEMPSPSTELVQTNSQGDH